MKLCIGNLSRLTQHYLNIWLKFILGTFYLSKNPPILTVDEATSALDNESEKIVQDSLESLAQNRTTFVIAHRLSTIRNAERIVVLSEEGIVETGTHTELLKLNGTYASLYNMQFTK